MSVRSRFGSAATAPLFAAIVLFGLLLLTWNPPLAGAQTADDELSAEEVGELVRADISIRTGLMIADIAIRRTEEVTWRDGCLGVYDPAATCLLRTFEGYVVWAGAGGTGYRYHADTSGLVIFAADGLALGSLSSAPLPEGVVATPETRGLLLAGTPGAPGFGLIVFGGGSYEELVGAFGCSPSATRFWATNEGRYALLVPASTVAAVNADFEALFAGSVPAHTPLLAHCTAPAVASDGPPALEAMSVGGSGPLGLGSYCWDIAGAPEQPQCDDTSGLVTTAQLTTLERGGRVTVFGLPASGIESVTAQAWERPAEGTSEGANRTSWELSGDPVALAASGEGITRSIVLDLPPGTYLLELAVVHEDGEATYGMQLDIN